MMFNDLDLVTRCLAVAGAALSVAMFLVPMLALALERLGALTPQGRKAFAFFATVLTLYAGAKHINLIVQEKPDWLNVEAYVPEENTNYWDKVVLEWHPAPTAIVPAATPLTISYAERGTTNWIHLADSDVGAVSNVFDSTGWAHHPTSCVFRVASYYEPTRIEITDLAVKASETSRYVRVSFTAPTNLYEAVAHIHARVKDAGQPFTEVGRISTVVKTNVVTIIGDFISGGKDREFRAILEKEEP